MLFRILVVAIRQNWEAFRYATEALKGDREVVVAIRQNWEAFRYVTEALNGDFHVVLGAVKKHRDALNFSQKIIRLIRIYYFCCY